MRQVRLFDITASQDLGKIEDPYKLLTAIASSDCMRCRRAEHRNTNEGQRITIYRGNPESDFWVVGKSPGVADGLEGMPYSFGSGELLMKWLRFIGKEDAFLTNPVFCAAKDDAAPSQAELKACSFYFDMLVSRLKPKAMMCLGNVGWRAVAREEDHAKSLADVVAAATPIQTRFGIPGWVVYHPAFFFKGTPDVDEAKAKTTKVLQVLKATL